MSVSLNEKGYIYSARINYKSMSNNEIIDYIKKNLDSGHSPEDIRKELINSGWPREKIEEAFEHIHQSKQTHYQAPKYSKADKESLNVLEKLKMILSQPGELFNRVKDEKDFRYAFRFHVLLVVIQLIIVNIILYFLPQIISSSGVSTPLGLSTFFSSPTMYSAAFILVNFEIVISLFGMFIGAALMHVVAVIFGAKKGYVNTYKTLVYSYTPMVVLYPLFLFGFVNPLYIIPVYAIISVWTIILEVKGFSRLHEISRGKAAGISLTPFIILGLMIMNALGIGGPPTIEYMGKLSNGFDSLGEPTDWDFYENGNFDITLYNLYSTEVTIHKIGIKLRGYDQISYEPDPPIVIAPDSTYTLNASESGLNLGYQFFRNTYIIDMNIELERGGVHETDSGWVGGTIPSKVPEGFGEKPKELIDIESWKLDAQGNLDFVVRNIDSQDIEINEVYTNLVGTNYHLYYRPDEPILISPNEIYDIPSSDNGFNFGENDLGSEYEVTISIQYEKVSTDSKVFDPETKTYVPMIITGRHREELTGTVSQ